MLTVKGTPYDEEPLNACSPTKLVKVTSVHKLKLMLPKPVLNEVIQEVVLTKLLGGPL